MAGRAERNTFLRKMSDADLKLLRVFIAIVESKGFVGAQVRLNMAQSLISESMKTLELRLGLRLCERGPTGYRLLPEGKRVYDAAIELLQAGDRFTDAVGQIHDGSWGQLRLGVDDNIISNPECKLPEAFAMMRADATYMSIQLDLGVGFNLVAALCNGKFDLVVVAVNRKIATLEYDVLYHEKRVLYCGRGHPLFDMDADRITQELVSSYECSSNGQFEVAEFEEFSLARSSGLVAHGVDSHLGFALSGLAVAALPVHIGDLYVKTGRLRALLAPGEESSLPIAAVSLANSKGTAAHRKFRRLLLDLHGASAGIAS